MSINKYRAWHKVKKEWINLESDYYGLDVKGDLCIYSVSTGELDIEWVMDAEVTYSTGLKDKNGVEIYEGDILKGGRLRCTGEFTIDNQDGAKVRFVDGMFKCGGISLVSVHKKGEVVGHIYDGESHE